MSTLFKLGKLVLAAFAALGALKGLVAHVRWAYYDKGTDAHAAKWAALDSFIAAFDSLATAYNDATKEEKP